MDYGDRTGSNHSTGHGESWNDIEQLLEELESSRETEKEIVESQIEDVEDEIENVGEVYERNVSKLWETIRGQVERLEQAERGAGEVATEVRSKLARLYEELRDERRQELENRLSLQMRKWDLERELSELQNFDDLLVSD